MFKLLRFALRNTLRTTLRTVLPALLCTLALALPAAAQSLPATIPLPNGFAPEGIAAGRGTTMYTGSLSGQGVYQFDVVSGEGSTLVEGTEGQPFVGMKHLARADALFVAGGASGRAFVFDASDGSTLATYQLAPEGESFINDVVITRAGATFTDSQNARIFVLPFGPGYALPAEDAFAELPLSGDWQQVEGFNANGIEALPGGRSLIVVNSTTGLLYTVEPETGEASEIDLGGESVTMGDGLLRLGRTLYVVRNRANEIVEIRLASDGASGEVLRVLTDEALRVPTTIASYGRALYAVNARFGTEATPETDYDAVRIER